MCGFDGVRRAVSRMEVEVRVGKLKNGKAAGKYEVTRKMVKGWRTGFGSCVVPEDWRSAVIGPLYKFRMQQL